MIRINLAKSSNFMNTGEAGNQLFNKDLDLKIDWSHFKKFLVVLTLPTVLVIYEKSNSFLLKESLKKSTAELDKVKQELEKFGDISSVIQELIKEKEEMNKKLEVIKEISKRRTLKTDILFKIQEKIPEQIWLKEVLFEKEKILINGYSRKDSSAQSIIEELKGIESVESVANKEIVGDEKIEAYKFDIELKLKE